MTIANKNVVVKIQAELTSAHGLVTPIATMNQSFKDDLDSATSYISLQSAISAGGMNIIDLYGSREDNLGNLSLFSKVLLYFVRNNSTLASGSIMKLGGHAQNIGFMSAGSIIRLHPQAAYLCFGVSGVSMSAGVDDICQITGTAGNQFQLIVFGRRTP